MNATELGFSAILGFPPAEPPTSSGGRDNLSLVTTAAELPKEILHAARQRLPSLRSLLAPQPQALEETEQALAVP